MRVHKLKNLPRSGKQLNINQNAFCCSQPSTCFEGITPLELVHLQVRLVIALPNSYIVGERIRALLTCTAPVAARQIVNIKLTPCNVLNVSLRSLLLRTARFLHLRSSRLPPHKSQKHAPGVCWTSKLARCVVPPA